MTKKKETGRGREVEVRVAMRCVGEMQKELEREVVRGSGAGQKLGRSWAEARQIHPAQHPCPRKCGSLGGEEVWEEQGRPCLHAARRQGPPCW